MEQPQPEHSEGIMTMGLGIHAFHKPTRLLTLHPGLRGLGV